MTKPRFAEPTFEDAVAGDTWGFTFNITNDDTGEAIDLSGYTLTVRVLPAGGTQPVLQKDLTIIDAAGGVAAFEFEPDETRSLQGGYTVELEVTDGATTETWIRGHQTFIPDTPNATT